MACNVFQFCTGLKVVGSLMILVVLAVVGLSYYAVVIASYGPELLDGGGKAAGALLVILVFHVLLFMLLWAYFSVVFTDPGGVPSGWRPAPQDQDEELGEAAPFSAAPLGQGGPEYTSNDPPPAGAVGGRRPRYCRKCMAFKPARCHHCSVCRRCILKMDHHCVWVVNCVGSKNYKYFLLFLFYTFLECTFTAAVLLPHFISFFEDPDVQTKSTSSLATTFLAFVLNLAFSLSVLGFLVMHTSMVLGNTTTIEAFEKKVGNRWRYDIGKRKNFEQVFGLTPLLWFLPLYSEEDSRRVPSLNGLDFPVRFDSESQDRW